MPGKPLDPETLQKDLAYVLHGTIYHQTLYDICPPRPGLRVLEAGCGSGKLGLGYALQGAGVTLMDIDAGVLKYTAELTRLLWQQKRGEMTAPVIALNSVATLKIAYGDRPFDFVFNEGVPHQWHRDDPRRQGAFNQMAAVTKPGGKVAVIGSNAHCPAMMEFALRVSHTYADMPEKQEPFTTDELLRCLMKAGLRDSQVWPVEDPLDLTQSRTLVGWGTKP